MNHPNVVTIYEVADYQGYPFIAMEYIEGSSLDVILEQGPLGVDDTTDVIIQVARGLLAAHEHGIIHRDIKPGNICVCRDGLVKILDFGLARIVGRDSLTEPDTVLGTMGYNSPEQVSGKPVDRRTDVWSLGVLLCRMLTQKMPFQGDNAPAIVYSIVHSPASDITELRSDIPHALQVLYRECLEKDPDKRPQSMTEILDLLGAKPVPVLSRRQGGSRKRRVLLAAFFGLLFVAVFLWVTRPYITDQGPAGTGSVWRIGILPFHDQTGRRETSAWPSLIQALFVSNLTGVSNIGTVDPLSLNALIRDKFNTDDPARDSRLYRVMQDADIAYVIDGTILKTETEHKIVANLVKPADGEVLKSCDAVVADENDLPAAVDSISMKMLGFFQIRILQGRYNTDLQPWLSRGTQNLDALKAFMQASEFLFNGVAGSERYLRRAIDLDSEFVAPRIWMISILIQRGHVDSAMIYYTRLLRLEGRANPFEQAMISWAGAYIKGDDMSRVNALQLALVYSPGNNILLYELARARYSLGEFQAAVDALRPAVDARWRHSPAYYLLGASYCMLGDYPQARRILERSLSITPIFRHTYGLLSGVAYKLGDKDAALRYEQLYIQEQENHGLDEADIYGMLARNHTYMGFTDNAIRCYHNALALRPNDGTLHLLLGDLLYQEREWEQARTEFTRVTEIDPSRADAYRMLGAVCESQGDNQGAVRQYVESLAHDSTSAEAVDVRSRLQRLLK
jgi:tetratricopeptide (TPR) repeat protein/TolB-like protein